MKCKLKRHSSDSLFLPIHSQFHKTSDQSERNSPPSAQKWRNYRFAICGAFVTRSAVPKPKREDYPKMDAQPIIGTLAEQKSVESDKRLVFIKLIVNFNRKNEEERNR